MNLKSKIKHSAAVAGIFLGLSISSAHAGIAGSMVLDIIGGCFSYGATGATGCGNTDTNKLEYATGSFTFNNTLSGISNPTTYAYLASVALHAEAPSNSAISFDDTRSKSFATLGDLQSDPLWNTAYTFVTAVLANPSTSSFTTTLPPFGSLTAFWNYTADPGSTPAYATGTFEAWSTNDLNEPSLAILGRALPAIPVNFSLNVTLNAIPEPAMIALIGLGILGMGTIQRRKVSATLPIC